MKLDASAKGTFAIAPTPFHPDGRIDTQSVDRMSDFYLEAGCAGLTVLGMMGEAQKLDGDEAISIVRQIAGRIGSKIPVVAGVSAPGFAAMRSLAQAAMDAGAAGVMIAPSPALRSDEQIIAYFSQAVEAIGPDVPWVLQDFPLSLGVVMTPDVIRRIVEACPSCVMLKHEDWPGLEKITRLRGFQADGRLAPLSILTGNGGLFLDFEMERGADGAMTGYAFPELLCDVVNRSTDGQIDAAHDVFDAHLPLIRYEQQPGVGLAVRKHVLKLRGAIASDAQRKPGQMLSGTAKREIAYLLARLSRLDGRAEAAAEAARRELP